MTGRRDAGGEGSEPAPDGVAQGTENGRIPGPADEDPPSSASSFASAFKQAIPYLGAAWTLTTALVLGFLAGWWLDGRLGTDPWLALAGLLLGLVIGMYEVARVALRLGKTNGK